MRHRLSLLLILLLALITSAIQPALPVAAQNCSNEAELVEQTLDPDAGKIAPDAEFTVTWIVRNEGDCTWDRTYRLNFIDGERMDSPRTTRLRGEVEPGETLTLSVDLTAPDEVGSHSGTWQLRSPDGDNFGPELTLEIEVGEGEAATTDIVLPEVLVFGGLGEGGDANVLYYCIDDGKLFDSPTMVVDDSSLGYRYAALYLCSFPEGTEITIELTDPDENTFSQTYVEDAAVTGQDDEGREYTGTVLQVNLNWIEQAPTGDWTVTATAEDFSDEVLLSIPPYTPFEGEDDYPKLDNWPTAPIDPFASVGVCHYRYTPGQEMMIGGKYLPPDTQLHIGFYQDRLGNGYLVDQVSVQSDEEGTFAIPYNALEAPGSYQLVLLKDVNPEGYSDDGTQYDFGFGGGETSFSCFTVAEEGAEGEIPLRLAFASGTLESSEIVVLDINTGDGYYATFTNGECNTAEPAWWPGGEWVLYQSNCVTEDTDQGIVWSAAGDYDLYASMIDFTYTLQEDETLIRLTQTPDLDETEPDANLNGVIVYRQTPAGTSLDESGELWLMDSNEESNTPLGLSGRAPTWSPDGSRIAFMSDVEGTWQIYVYDLEDDELWLVSEGCDTHCRLPAWSPDGKQLLYHHSVSLEDPTPDSVWFARVDGGKPRRWLSGLYGRPSWSGEGWIALQGADGIYRATSGLRPTVERYLYSNPEVASHWAPVWSR